MASDFSPEGESITEAARRYKAGIPMNELLPLGERALRAEEVELVGVHAHFARHTRRLDAWAAMMRAFGDVVGHLSAAWGGWQPSESMSEAACPPAGTQPAVPSRAWPPSRPGATAGTVRRGDRLSLSEALAAHGLSPPDTTLEVEPAGPVTPTRAST